MPTQAYGHEFASAVIEAKRAITKSPFPILECLLIRRNGRIEVIGTDLESANVGLCGTLAAEEDTWAIAIPARPISDWLKSIEFPKRNNRQPWAVIDLLPNLKEHTLTIATESDGARIRATFKGIDAQEFPITEGRPHHERPKRKAA